MKLNSRVTWGLAWTGLALVIAVPSVDMVTAQFASKQALVIDESPATSAPAVKQVALVAPVPAARPAFRDQVAAASKTVQTTVALNASDDPVDRFVSSGKQLPSYLTGSDTPSTQVPAESKPATQPAVTTAAAATPEQPVTWGESKWATPGGKNPVGTLGTQPTPETVTAVASLGTPTELVAPVPMPASMRPKASVARPVVQSPGIDPQTVASFDGGDRVTASDLKNWESGPLSEFLAKRQQGKRIAQQPQRQPQQYDPRADGDFIEYDAGPQYIGPVNDGSFFIWN